MVQIFLVSKGENLPYHVKNEPIFFASFLQVVAQLFIYTFACVIIFGKLFRRHLDPLDIGIHMEYKN